MLTNRVIYSLLFFSSSIELQNWKQAGCPEIGHWMNRKAPSSGLQAQRWPEPWRDPENEASHSLI